MKTKLIQQEKRILMDHLLESNVTIKMLDGYVDLELLEIIAVLNGGTCSEKEANEVLYVFNLLSGQNLTTSDVLLNKKKRVHMKV